MTDNHGGTATNTLTGTVNGINTPPLTGTITAGSVTEDTSTVLTGIMTAPPDPNPHDTVVFLPQLGTAGAYGTLTLAASGRYTYVLNKMCIRDRDTVSWMSGSSGLGSTPVT